MNKDVIKEILNSLDKEGFALVHYLAFLSLNFKLSREMSLSGRIFSLLSLFAYCPIDFALLLVLKFHCVYLDQHIRFHPR